MELYTVIVVFQIFFPNASENEIFFSNFLCVYSARLFPLVVKTALLNSASRTAKQASMKFYFLPPFRRKLKTTKFIICRIIFHGFISPLLEKNRIILIGNMASNKLQSVHSTSSSSCPIPVGDPSNLNPNVPT